MHTSANVLRHWIPLKLVLQASVSHPVWVLGNEFRSSTRALHLSGPSIKKKKKEQTYSCDLNSE